MIFIKTFLNILICGTTIALQAVLISLMFLATLILLYGDCNIILYLLYLIGGVGILVLSIYYVVHMSKYLFSNLQIIYIGEK